MTPKKILWFISGAVCGAVILYIMLLTMPHLNLTSLKQAEVPEQEQSQTEEISKTGPLVKKEKAHKPSHSKEAIQQVSQEQAPEKQGEKQGREKQGLTLQNTDSLPLVKVDTSIYDTTEVILLEEPLTSENTEVEKDLLLESKIVKINQILAENKKQEIQKIRVEFWQSPVHYKGYKLGETTLILFGLEPSEVRIEKQKNILWLYHKNTVYLLQPNTDFKPYNKVKNQSK